MSSQLQYLLIGACILGFAAMEFITRRYQAAVRGNATANDAWLEVLMFVSLIAITRPAGSWWRRGVRGDCRRPPSSAARPRAR
jgi:hypothetical protein